MKTYTPHNHGTLIFHQNLYLGDYQFLLLQFNITKISDRITKKDVELLLPYSGSFISSDFHCHRYLVASRFSTVLFRLAYPSRLDAVVLMQPRVYRYNRTCNDF